MLRVAIDLRNFCSSSFRRNLPSSLVINNYLKEVCIEYYQTYFFLFHYLYYSILPTQK